MRGGCSSRSWIFVSNVLIRGNWLDEHHGAVKAQSLNCLVFGFQFVFIALTVDVMHDAATSKMEIILLFLGTQFKFLDMSILKVAALLHEAKKLMKC